jgi:2-oxoisovalerate dehydrogenase E1 component
MDPAESVHTAFVAALRDGALPPRRSTLTLADAALAPEQLLGLYHSQVMSRQLDRAARRLQARGEGFYTIGSSGHEGNAALAAATRLGDMAFLHYRDAAFQIERARQRPGETPLWDMLLSFAASAEDPISGGRHKVLGSKALAIPPQTSTIASHLPKAVGAAFSIGIARAIGLDDRPLAEDAIILASFGDASANHSTAQGAINTACWAAYQGSPMPILFLCEDNGIGISTRTPAGWIAASFRQRPALRYIACDGLDLLDTMRAAREAVDHVRTLRKPVFLHMACTRLYGHAGSDVQASYLSRAEIAACEARDPLLHGAALITDLGLMRPDQLLDLYEEVGETIDRVAEEAIRRPKLTTSAQVMASLVPPRRTRPRDNGPSAEQRAALFASDAAQMDKPQHMARLLSWALADLMLDHPEIVVAGEDVGPKGGVYNVTARLHQRFGPARVINTLLDEQSILGLGIGFAHNDLLAITEIQFLAYVHNAEDQLRGEAATLPFFSNGQYANPMIVRIAGLGYQKGFGGHFHNDNSLAIFRDIPGLIVACPSSGRDAIAMLRECVRLAREENRVVIFVEPIALYMTRDLHTEGDGLWTSTYDRDAVVPLGALGQTGEGEDLAILSYGNGVYLSCQARKVLAESHGVDARVIDLRWLAPVDMDAVLAAIGPCARVLIVDECRVTGSQSEMLMALLAERAPHLAVSRIAAEDSFIPLGRAATLTLPSRESIVAAALKAVGRG